MPQCLEPRECHAGLVIFPAESPGGERCVCLWSWVSGGEGGWECQGSAEQAVWQSLSPSSVLIIIFIATTQTTLILQMKMQGRERLTM